MYKSILKKISAIIVPILYLICKVCFKLSRKMTLESTARRFSNSELRKFASLYNGNIINVSGYLDSDKEGSTYKTYFSNAKSYTISNFKGEKGLTHSENEIFMDLEAPLPNKLIGKFDVAYNHTTLEHIFDIDTAFENICALSNDTVILVVPFLQPQHWIENSFEDYWRITPFALIKLFKKHGLETLYFSFNDNFASSTYIFAIASKQPDKWKSKFPEMTKMNMKSYFPGDSLSGLLVD